MNTVPPIYKLKVQRPAISPKITPIGYGNPRYNSMLAYKNGVLVTVGSHLRWVDLEQGKILYDQQIGNSQIFQLLENSTYFMVVNFQGLVSLLLKDSFEIKHQFYLPGKQIRHSSITNNLNNLDENYISLACELSDQSKGTILVVYSLKQIQKKNYQPFWECDGSYYYPQFYKQSLVLIFFNDPNPKGRKRKQTVMNKKLPIINRIVKLDNTFKQIFSYDIKSQGQIICAAQVDGAIYYLHNNKKMTVFDVQKQVCAQFALQTKSYPLVIEPYGSGVAIASTSNELLKIVYNFELSKPEYTFEKMKTSAIGVNHALKFTNNGFYSLNDFGLHYYNRQTRKTYTQNIFNVTNCGLTFNKEGNQIAVADFTGFVRIFSVPESSVLPQPIFEIFIGKPVRSIAWCHDSNKIAIGCIGGSLYSWKIGDSCLTFAQLNRTVNILRADQSRFYVGTSDGLVKIYDSFSLKLIYEFQAHSPIFYDTVEQRQMFGTMQHYAQIWSMTLSPQKGNKLKIITCSQDQSEKIFQVDLASKTALQEQHLKGHQLAVTSIDWKIMNENIGQIYVSCSDDKIVRFRNPKDNFNILFELETSTIKEWHTLTYLSLEPNGHRVAVGSQNGYLFIFDIQKKVLIFGEKVHLGGIQGLDWKNNMIVTCSSDLCLNVIEL